MSVSQVTHRDLGRRGRQVRWDMRERGDFEPPAPRHEEGKRGGGDVKRIVRRGGQICKFKAPPPLSSSVNEACPIKCKFPSPRNALAAFNISSASALDRLVHGGLGVPRLLK